MHTMKRVDANNFSVGYYKPIEIEYEGAPINEWYPIIECNSFTNALAFVNYLNGGEGYLLTACNNYRKVTL